jgi:hypothetical protein
MYPLQPDRRPAPAGSSYPPAEYSRSRIRGYSRITAWIKKKYPGKFNNISDPYLLKKDLDTIAGDRMSLIPAKTWAGFLEYLKKQNYEQLLR